MRNVCLVLAAAILGACGGDGSPEADPAPAGADVAAAAAPADSTDRTASVGGLAGPEAVRFDPEQRVWFVANFGEEADEDRDANGFISRLGADGALAAREFMRGTESAPLHMPRGMIIEGDTLWVADVDGVHGFDRRTGSHLAFIDFTSLEPGFLNDLALGGDGALYATDTGRGRVYRVAGGAPEIAIEDERTGPPNGITWDAGREAFLLAPWGGGHEIQAWRPGGELETVATVPGGRFDGIEVVQGRILLASQADSSLWLVEGDEPRRIVRLPGRPADIGVDPERGLIAVPYVALDRVDFWEIPPGR